MMNIQINKKNIEYISLIYIYCPVCLFLIAWTKPWIAFSCMLVLVLVGYRFFKKRTAEDVYVEISIGVIIFVIVFLLFIGFTLGWGGWNNQTWDWEKHNALLADLVKRDWPVYYYNCGEYSYLSYYVGQYLLPAVIGKIVGSVRIAEIALYIWCEIGLMIVYLNIIRVLRFNGKVMQIFTVLLMCFFSVPRELSKFMLELFTEFQSIGDVFYSDGISRLEYSDNIMLFSYVIPQVIVIWLIMLLFLDNKNNVNYYMFMLLPGILFGPLGMIGVAIFAGVQFVCFSIKQTNIKTVLFSALSLENILIAISLGVVLLAYLWGNISVNKPAEIGFRLIDYSGDRIWIYIIFVVFNIIILIAPMLKDYKNNVLYWTMVVSLLLFPLVMMGKNNDLMMRASIPALFMLMLLVLQYFQKRVSADVILCDMKNITTVDKKKTYTNQELLHFLSIIFVCIIISFGFVYGIKVVNRQLSNYQFGVPGIIPSLNGDEPIDTLEEWANRSNKEYALDQRYNYFAYDYENGFFYRYLAREK